MAAFITSRKSNRCLSFSLSFTHSCQIYIISKYCYFFFFSVYKVEFTLNASLEFYAGSLFLKVRLYPCSCNNSHLLEVRYQPHLPWAPPGKYSEIYVIHPVFLCFYWILGNIAYVLCLRFEIIAAFPFVLSDISLIDLAFYYFHASYYKLHHITFANLKAI